MSPGLGAAWLAAQRQRADTAPLRPRLPLLAGRARIGSVEPGFLLPFQGLRGADGQALLDQVPGAAGWRLNGDASDSLARLAQAMRAAGLAGAWRNELLAVQDETGQRLGVVERAAVRPLGIATHAVHLVLTTPDAGPSAHTWVQQRAWDKANDPGMWDTTMGGMVPASDTLQQALERETWEEAGLRLQQLQGLAHGGQLWIRRPQGDGGGAGYMVELIDWYRAVLPAGIEPVNQDGEVQGFEKWGRERLVECLLGGMFTLEGGLILAAAQAGAHIHIDTRG